jgi:hypothetical protein
MKLIFAITSPDTLEYNQSEVIITKKFSHSRWLTLYLYFWKRHDFWFVIYIIKNPSASQTLVNNSFV